MAFLDRFARIVADYYPQSTVTVEGFTDPVGDEAYNLALGKRRAESVKGYLVQQGGLSADRIRAVSPTGMALARTGGKTAASLWSLTTLEPEGRQPSPAGHDV